MHKTFLLSLINVMPLSAFSDFKERISLYVMFFSKPSGTSGSSDDSYSYFIRIQSCKITLRV
jgi:hypothetical protein